MRWTPCRTVGGSRSRRNLRSVTVALTASCSRSPIRDRGFPRKSCPTCASRSSPPGPRAQASASRSRSATSRKPAAAWTSPVGSVTAPPCVSGCPSPAVTLGAFDYVKKPVDLEELKLLADRARENRLLKQELSYYRRRATRDVGFATMVGESRAVRAVLERARQIAALEDTPPVLLTGETGTGKGILAHAIHAAGPRASKPFIEVNCTTLPATLMEAELFGYERGAFTDAKESKPGLVEAAEGGVLFLDEIGDVDLSVQGKLLRAIEERTVRRVGSVRERKVDVRIVAATNRDLERAVR